MDPVGRWTGINIDLDEGELGEDRWELPLRRRRPGGSWNRTPGAGAGGHFTLHVTCRGTAEGPRGYECAPTEADFGIPESSRLLRAGLFFHSPIFYSRTFPDSGSLSDSAGSPSTEGLCPMSVHFRPSEDCTDAPRSATGGRAAPSPSRSVASPCLVLLHHHRRNPLLPAVPRHMRRLPHHVPPPAEGAPADPGATDRFPTP